MGRTSTMRTLLTCLWPGLAPLWWRGQWPGLVEALAFAAGLNLLLVATLVWPEWFQRPWASAGWFVLSGVWLVACWRNWRKLPTLVDDRIDAATQGLFTQAQIEYLKGNWYDAEKLLKQLLQHRPRDIEGLLLQATLLRHTRRLDEAAIMLDKLERLNGSGRWVLEIAQERQRIEKLAVEVASSHGAAEVEAEDKHRPLAA
jgi:hypothetical protein